MLLSNSHDAHNLDLMYDLRQNPTQSVRGSQRTSNLKYTFNILAHFSESQSLILDNMHKFCPNWVRVCRLLMAVCRIYLFVCIHCAILQILLPSMRPIFCVCRMESAANNTSLSRTWLRVPPLESKQHRVRVSCEWKEVKWTVAFREEAKAVRCESCCCCWCCVKCKPPHAESLVNVKTRAFSYFRKLPNKSHPAHTYSPSACRTRFTWHHIIKSQQNF